MKFSVVFLIFIAFYVNPTSNNELFVSPFTGTAAASRVFNEALAKIAVNAQQGGTTDIGKCNQPIHRCVSVYNKKFFLSYAQHEDRLLHDVRVIYMIKLIRFSLTGRTFNIQSRRIMCLGRT